MAKREAPYVYAFKEFPKLLYRLAPGGLEYRTVGDETDQADAEADGWTTSPDGVVTRKGKK